MLNKLIEIIKYAQEAQERYRRIQSCKNELNRLTDAELNDIGINRCDINRIAHGGSR